MHLRAFKNCHLAVSRGMVNRACCRRTRRRCCKRWNMSCCSRMQQEVLQVTSRHLLLCVSEPVRDLLSRVPDQIPSL